jgi:Flp pilus assembly protein TadD
MPVTAHRDGPPHTWTEPVRAPVEMPAGAELAAIRHATRAALLYGMRRYRQAERHARAALAAEPDSPQMSALLAACLSGLGRHVEAEQAAATAIRGAPADPDGYKIMAVVLLSGDQPARAESAITEVLRLAPAEPDGYALLAGARGQQGDWRGALAAAERGLGADPEHPECAQLRALALTGLNHAGADAAVRASLADDPELATGHALRGLQRLRIGDFASAGEHFRQALRLDPDNEPVRAGLIETLKARNRAYAVLLRLQLGTYRMSRFIRVALLVVFVGVLRHSLSGLLRGDGRGVVPMSALVIAFVAAGLAPMLFNLTLVADPFGRLVLGRAALRTTVVVAAGLVAAAATLIAAALTSRPGEVTGALGFTFAAATVAVAARCPPGWRRRAGVLGAAGVAVLAAAATAAAVAPSLLLPGGIGLDAACLLAGLLGLLLAKVLAATARTTGSAR